MAILSKRDHNAAVRYAMDRIDEALAQALMRDFCKENDIVVGDVRGINQRPGIINKRIRVAVYLSGRGFKRRVIAAVMNKHYDMVRYYTKPALRKRKQIKNRLNAIRWRIPAEIKVNHGLTAN